jgi:hypothetical protein
MEMRVGDIFRKTFAVASKKLTLRDVERATPKHPAYKSYGAGVVSKRGNVFKNRNININKLVDDSLKKPLSSLR